MVATGRLAHNPPSAPVLPFIRCPGRQMDMKSETRITVIPTTQPIAISAESITTKPMNVMAGKLPLLIFRDSASGEVKVFDRRVDEDLMPRFECNHDPRRKLATFVDSDTNTGWSNEGVAVDGDKQRKGKKLKPFPVEEDLYWGVMKFWYPELQDD